MADTEVCTQCGGTDSDCPACKGGGQVYLDRLTPPVSISRALKARAAAGAQRQRVRLALASIRYRNWLFIVGGQDETLYLQPAYPGDDWREGDSYKFGGKYVISPDATPEEIIRQAYHAVAMTEMMAIPRRFKINGEPARFHA